MAEVRHISLSSSQAEVQKPTGVSCLYALEQMPAGIAPNFPRSLVSNLLIFPPSQQCGTKKLGRAASLKHFFFPHLLAASEEYKSLSWKDFGGAASELKGWLILPSDGRWRCQSQAAMQQVTHMGGINISYSPRPPPPNLAQLCPLQGRCGEQAPTWLCGGPAVRSRVSHLECQVSGHRASIHP